MPKKILNKNFSVYDQAKISDWKTSLATIPETIEQERQTLQQYDDQLKFYQSELKKLQTEQLDPVEALVNKLTAQIQYLTLPEKIRTVKDQIGPLEVQVASEKNRLEEVTATIGFYKKTIANLEKHIKIKNLEAENAALVVEMRGKANKLSRLQPSLAMKKDQTFALRKRIEDLSNQTDSLTQAKLTNNASTESNFTTSMQQGSGFTTSISGDMHATDSGYLNSISNVNPTNYDSEIVRLENELKRLKVEELNANQEKTTLENQVATIQHNINSLRNKITFNELSLHDYNEDDINSANAQDLTYLKLEVSKQVSEQIPYEQEKNRIERILSKLNPQLMDLKNKHRELTSNLEYYTSRRGEYAESTNLTDLDIQLDQQKNIRAPLLEEKKRINGQVDYYASHISSQNREISRLQKKHQDLNSDGFMWKFWTQPDLLINELVSQSEKALTRFEEEHPANQSDKTRLTIADIRDKLATIQQIKLHESIYSDYLSNIQSVQIKYQQLCGLLWDQLKQLDEDKDYYLAQELLSILRSNPIDEHLARGEFNKLGLQPMPMSVVTDKEERDYQVAYDNLQRLITPMQNSADKAQKKVFASGTHLLNTLLKQKGKEAPNTGLLKFHTNILQTAAQLTQPHDEKVDKKFHHLIHENKDGKRSLCKQIFGAALMFLSVAGSAVSSFFLPPLGIIGSAVCGTAGTSTGFGLFMSGRSKGIDKATNNFESDTKKLTFFPPAPSAPPLETTPLMQDNDNKQHETDGVLYPDLRPVF